MLNRKKVDNCLSVGTRSWASMAAKKKRRAMCNLQVLKRNLGFAFATLCLFTISCSSMAVAADDPPYKLAGGLAIYIGVVPAEIVKGHPSPHAEKTMHGGAPKGAHE